MTREEKINLAFSYCKSYKGCGGCPNGEEAAARCIPCEFNKMPDYELDGFLSRFKIRGGLNLSGGGCSGHKVAPATHDNVNPNHYKLPNGMQVIDIEVAMFGKEAVMHHCFCTAVEYILRHNQKNGSEDIHKAHWWLSKYIELEAQSE